MGMFRSKPIVRSHYNALQFSDKPLRPFGLPFGVAVYIAAPVNVKQRGTRRSARFWRIDGHRNVRPALNSRRSETLSRYAAR